MEKKKMQPISDWIRESFTIYFKRENLVYLTKFALLQLLFSSVIFLFLFITTRSLESSADLTGSGLPADYLVPFIVITIIVAILNLWISVSTIKAISQVLEGKMLGVGETLKAGVGRLVPFIIGSIFVGIIVVLGLLALIIPGVVFLIWFYFTTYFIAADDVSPIAALRKSRELTRGYFWPLIGRVAVMFVYMFLINLMFSFVMIPLVSTILLSLAGPYFTLLPYLLLVDLKSLKKK